MQSLAEPISLGSETTDNMDEDRGQAWCLLALIAEAGRLSLAAADAGSEIDLEAPKIKTISPARLVWPFLRASQLWP